MQARQIILFDFVGLNPSRTWRVINDTVMGGISISRFEISDSGVAVFSGVVSLENQGGFASARSPVPELNLKGFAGLEIRVRGDGKTYKLGLRTDLKFDGVFHQASFPTDPCEWGTIQFPFEEFVPTYHGRRLSDVPPPDPGDIKTLSFLVSDKQDGPFRLEIAWVRACAGR